MSAIAVAGANESSAVAQQSGLGARWVNAAEFQDLLVSHRRMVRIDRRDTCLRGLQDLDSGELFFIDERRLFDVRR